MNKEDLEFVQKYAPDIPLCGGVGAEMWRPAGFDESVRHLQILDRLGYYAIGFYEQTQSWIFRATWPLTEQSSELPEYEAFYDTFALVSAVAPQTENLRFTITTDCYRRPPSVIAQSLLTLDHISKGRTSILVGTGENKQFLPHGLKRELPRLDRLEEFVRVTKALLRTTEPLTMDGKFWPQEDGLIAVPAYDPDKPPAVYIVGGGPRAMQIAGGVADGLGTYLPGAYANRLDVFEEQLAIMRATAVEQERDPASIPVLAAHLSVLCENEGEIERALVNPYLKASVLNLTPTAKHWEMWGSKHPLGDNYFLSGTHRATNFTKEELLEAFAKVTPHDIQQMVYVGTPEDVAERFAPWVRAEGLTEVPLGATIDFGTTIFKEHRQLAADGLPRWHHLQVRFRDALNKALNKALKK